MTDPEKVLIVSPHPDDETLGAGGTLLQHQQRGDEIHCLLMTELAGNDNSSLRSDVPRLRREKEIVEASEHFQWKSFSRLGLPTTRLDEQPYAELTENIGAVISGIKPTTVYLPHCNDVHTDHRVTFTAAFSCTKNFRYPSVQRVLSYEVPSETDYSAVVHPPFLPNVFVDVTSTFSEKLDIMKIFASELGEHPFPRSLRHIEALAVHRGASAGCQYAEAFMLLKEIVRR